MTTQASAWIMAEAGRIPGRGFFSRDISGTVPYGIVSGTEKRDVSESLDLLALSDTPFINRIGWGPESGGSTIEWISEDLGPGKMKNVVTIASECASFVATSVDGITASATMYQIKEGSVLYKYSSINGYHTLAVVTSTKAETGVGVSIFLSLITANHGAAMMSLYASIVSSEVWYVLGAFANEGSVPQPPMPRQRALLSNQFTILRQDVQITGTMMATDMYAIGREDRHQILMRLKELQRDRERAALYSVTITKTSDTAGLMDGVLGFLARRTGAHIDTSTKTMTESTFNTIVNAIWEAGGRNLTVFGHISQTAKFTQWDKNRIRMRINDRKGGGYITSFLTESGIEVDVVPMGNVPPNLVYILDTSRIKLRAKRGRKAIMEKLGKMGDFEDWQILSEFTMEMKGADLRQHGGFFNLIDIA